MTRTQCLRFLLSELPVACGLTALTFTSVNFHWLTTIGCLLLQAHHAYTVNGVRFRAFLALCQQEAQEAALERQEEERDARESLEASRLHREAMDAWQRDEEAYQATQARLNEELRSL